MSGRLAILGGCGGIGRALVRDATREGWDTVVLDLPASIEAHPLQVEMHPVDATTPASMAAGAEAVGLVDGFVNLCGFMGAAVPVTQQDPSDWTNLIEGNLTSALHATQAMAPKMNEGAAMVLTGSGLGHFARPGYGAYAIAKAGIAALTRQLALELAPNCRVNCVAPSAVDTAFLRGGTGRSDEQEPERLNREAYEKSIPLGRIAVPEDISGPILFLLSKAARYMTGQVIHVNGGTYMG